MANTLPRKTILWNQIKLANEMGKGIPIDKSYVDYTVAEFESLLLSHNVVPQGAASENSVVFDGAEAEFAGVTAPAPRQAGPEATPLAPAGAGGTQGVTASYAAEDRWPRTQEGLIDWPVVHQHPIEYIAEMLGIPVSDQGARRAGLTFNTHGLDDPVRIDTQGRIWFQDEVAKPAIPLPRGRRVTRERGSGVQTLEIRGKDGHLDETFEIAGEMDRIVETKTTLQSWQVGIYKHPRLPFRTHIYNGLYAFDRRDIVMFYGHKDLVPGTIETTYIGYALCFDIRTTREALEKEARDRTLQGREYQS